jgi:addiction module HigA family antidote
MKSKIPTPTIGEILKEEFLTPLSITAYRLAKQLHVSTSTVLDLINGKRKLSVEMALKLSKFFGTSDKFWINLQTDIEIRNKKQKIKTELDKIATISKGS